MSANSSGEKEKTPGVKERLAREQAIWGRLYLKNLAMRKTTAGCATGPAKFCFIFDFTREELVEV